MRYLRQVATAAKFSLLTFRRNPAASFFTIIFPIIFLLLFGFLFGSEEMDSGASVATFQVPGILALSVISATFVNLAISTTFRRELGQLKRLRSTPMPPLVYLIGQILGVFVIVAFMTVLVTLIGRILFDTTFNFETIGVFVISLFLGTLAFSAMGFGVTALIPSQDAAPAITNFIVLPLYFISDVFVQVDGESTISKIASFFPVQHLARSLQQSYNPFLTSVEVPWTNWLVLAIWGVIGVVGSLLFFRWTPRRS